MVRALRILHAFADARPEWSLAGPLPRLGLSKPTAFRLLLALEHEGLVVRHETLNTYRLGPAAIELGARAQRASSVIQRRPARAGNADPGHRRNDERRGPRGRRTLILDEVQGGHLIGTSPSVGTRWPAHATSTGKVLLAAAMEADPDLIRRMARRTGGRLRGITPSTIRSARQTSPPSCRGSSRQGTPPRSASWRWAMSPSARRFGGTTAGSSRRSRSAGPAPGSPIPGSRSDQGRPRGRRPISQRLGWSPPTASRSREAIAPRDSLHRNPCPVRPLAIPASPLAP